MPCGDHLELSIGVMEETRFKKKHSHLIKRLAKELHFTYEEMEVIMLIYYKIQKMNGEKSGGVTKVQLREILHVAFDMTDVDLTNDVVMSMVKGPSSFVPMSTWARVMSLFLRGTLEEKISHCFKVYDVMMSGKIGRDIMVRFLRNCLVGTSDEDSEDAVKDLVELLTKKMDMDRDLKISFDDYRQTILKDPLLMECMGQCLPSRLSVHSFMISCMAKVSKL
ncbi:EF-hand calcium-binding domain-containing protein 1-like [Photinus pyralis]|uniref:Uncharacterized protein n=1 Tax=Photinus pyralis TaxID=7054 RepID=A0A1Y1LJE5_PHOPY|nr:EF-hand calcium-binding domain-containing protein 1-like [Photinus pyralis]